MVFLNFARTPEIRCLVPVAPKTCAARLAQTNSRFKARPTEKVLDKLRPCISVLEFTCFADSADYLMRYVPLVTHLTLVRGYYPWMEIASLRYLTIPRLRVIS